MTAAVHMQAPEGVQVVTLELDFGASQLLAELVEQTRQDASEVVGWALGAYWRELEGVVLPPPTHDDHDAAMAEALADIEAGRLVPHDEVMAAARKLTGG